MDKYKHYTDKELKEEFIKNFGEEKWNEEEMLSSLHEIEMIICNELVVEPVPVIVEDIPDDSRLDFKNGCIVISKNKIMDKKEALKCLIHEYRHIYQITTVIGGLRIHPLFKIWEENVKTLFHPEDVTNMDEVQAYMEQPLEIDAFAYTKYFFDKFLGEKLICFDDETERYFDKYIKMYLVHGM